MYTALRYIDSTILFTKEPVIFSPDHASADAAFILLKWGSCWNDNIASFTVAVPFQASSDDLGRIPASYEKPQAASS